MGLLQVLEKRLMLGSWRCDGLNIGLEHFVRDKFVLFKYAEQVVGLCVLVVFCCNAQVVVGGEIVAGSVVFAKRRQFVIGQEIVEIHFGNKEQIS